MESIGNNSNFNIPLNTGNSLPPENPNGTRSRNDSMDLRETSCFEGIYQFFSGIFGSIFSFFTSLFSSATNTTLDQNTNNVENESVDENLNTNNNTNNSVIEDEVDSNISVEDSYNQSSFEEHDLDEVNSQNNSTSDNNDSQLSFSDLRQSQEIAEHNEEENQSTQSFSDLRPNQEIEEQVEEEKLTTQSFSYLPTGNYTEDNFVQSLFTTNLEENTVHQTNDNLIKPDKLEEEEDFVPPKEEDLVEKEYYSNKPVEKPNKFVLNDEIFEVQQNSNFEELSMESEENINPFEGKLEVTEDNIGTNVFEEEAKNKEEAIEKIESELNDNVVETNPFSVKSYLENIYSKATRQANFPTYTQDLELQAIFRPAPGEKAFVPLIELVECLKTPNILTKADISDASKSPLASYGPLEPEKQIVHHCMHFIKALSEKTPQENNQKVEFRLYKGKPEDQKYTALFVQNGMKKNVYNDLKDYQKESLGQWGKMEYYYFGDQNIYIFTRDESDLKNS